MFLVPPDLLARLVAWARGYITTKVIEDSVHVIKTRAAGSSSGVCCRAMRWAALRESDLLKRYGMSDIQPEPQDEVEAMGQDVNFPELYDASLNDYSLQESEFKQIMTMHNHHAYPQVSPENFHMTGLLFEAYSMCDSYTHFKTHWMSALAPVGGLLTRPELRTTEHGEVTKQVPIGRIG